MIRPNSRAWLLVWLLWPLILIAALLSGCVKRAEDVVDASAMWEAHAIEVTDPKTGCAYLTFGANTITPRMGADGKQICRPVKDAK